MIYLLDSNSWIEYLNNPQGKVARRIVATDFKQIRLCSIVMSELFFGAFKSRQAAQNLKLLSEIASEFESVSFDDRAARIAGEVRAYLAKAGRPIGANDLLIAATALANGLTVVTHNVGEFDRVPALLVEDWQAGI